MIQYNVQAGANGSIVIPTTPFAIGEEIGVVLTEQHRQPQPFDDDYPTPTDEQLEKMYTMCRGCLEGMTQEEFEQLREKRILGVK
jgi:hypothetical protein